MFGSRSYRKFGFCVALVLIASGLGTRFVHGEANPSRANRLKQIPLQKLDGGTITGIPYDHTNLTVVVFVSSECGITNAYAPTLRSLWYEYRDQSVAFWCVYTDVRKPLTALQCHARDFQLPPTAVFDSHLQLASELAATVTPQAFLIDRSGAILYKGRIDDRYQSYGVVRHNDIVPDLALAIDAALAGKSSAEIDRPALGCFIPFPRTHGTMRQGTQR